MNGVVRGMKRVNIHNIDIRDKNVILKKVSKIGGLAPMQIKVLDGVGTVARY